jgi:hypothetical protein
VEDAVGGWSVSVGDIFGVLVGVKNIRAKASTVRMRSVLVGVGVSNPVFGMIRSGSTTLVLLVREIRKGRLNARLHVTSTMSRIR